MRVTFRYNSDDELFLGRELLLTELKNVEITEWNPEATIYYHYIPEDLSTVDSNSILILGEPYQIKYITKEVFAKFDKIVTSQFTGRFKDKIILSNQFLPNQLYHNSDLNLRYVELSEKNKLLSIICSPKEYTSVHLQRIKFTKELKKYFGDNIDVFGLDSKFDDKSEALINYKCTVSIENTVDPHSWTEKLSDCLLARCVPIYFGSINISEYFDNIKTINIYNISESIDTIKKYIEEIEWHPGFESDRNKYLDKFSLPAFLNKLAEGGII